MFAGVNAALHVALERSVGSFTNEIWLEQHFHVKETFSAGSDDVFRLGARRQDRSSNSNRIGATTLISL